MNMPRPETAPDLEIYRRVLQKWMPKAEVRPAGRAFNRWDGLITWRNPTGTVRYLVEEKRHFRHQDVAVLVEQLKRRKAGVPAHRTDDRILLLAPHVRPQQAVVLERAEIDYLDLAGNAHLQAPGMFVHVEGRQPPKEAPTAPGRPQKGWVKAVMAILIRPELTDAPYRVLADEADVALGTLAACIQDLTRRGVLVQHKGGRRVPDRQALVALWVQAYTEVLRPKLKEQRFQLRARDKQEIWTQLEAVLRPRGDLWALTGADAAERRTHFFRAEETEIYAPIRILADRQIQRALIAQPTGQGGNLLVIEPPGPLALPDNTAIEIPMAPDLLTYAELRYRGTTQALEAAELLLPKVLDDGPH
jgi:hypothetical protein